MLNFHVHQILIKMSLKIDGVKKKDRRVVTLNCFTSSIRVGEVRHSSVLTFTNAEFSLSLCH